MHQRVRGNEPVPIQLALASGHRFLGLVEPGKAGNLTEVAELEGMDAPMSAEPHHAGTGHRGCHCERVTAGVRDPPCSIWRRARRCCGMSRGRRREIEPASTPRYTGNSRC